MKLPSIRVLADAAFDAGEEFDPAFPPSERTVRAWRTCSTIHSGEPDQTGLAVGTDELAAIGIHPQAVAC